VIGGYQSQYTLQALDTDGTVLQSWKVSPGDFRVDLSNFGSPGDKNITLRIAESPLSTAQVPVIVDDARLEQRAQELIAQGLHPWETTSLKLYVPSSLRNYSSIFQNAAEFWSTYSVFRFEILIGQHSDGERGYIQVWDETSTSSGKAAETNINADHGRNVDSSIIVYQGWIVQEDWCKEFIISHELWHALAGTFEEAEYYSISFGSRFPGYQKISPLPLSEAIIPPILQRTLQILNSRTYHTH